MINRANRHPVSASARALQEAVTASGVALSILVVALFTAPLRLARSWSRAVDRPVSIKHIQVQVHLEDARAAGDLARIVRHTLERAARTWSHCSCQSTESCLASGFKLVAGWTPTRTFRAGQRTPNPSRTDQSDPLWSSHWACGTVSATLNLRASPER